MAITDFITHKFSRQAGADTHLTLRDSVVPPSEYLDLFCSELKMSFQRRAGREYGCFSANEEGKNAVLPEKLKALISGDANFVATSVQWMYALKTAMDEADIEMHGHVVFMKEEHMGDEIFYIFVVSYKESLLINNDLNVEQISYVDFGTTMMAAKVDLSLWDAKDSSRSYLTLGVPRSSNAWVDTFRALSGFASTIDKKAETEKFLQSVSAFSLDIPKESVNEFQSKVVDFCIDQDKQGEAIEYAALSEAVSEVSGVDAGKFTQTLVESRSDSEKKVHLDRNGLKKFRRFTGREKELTVSFDAEQLVDRIRYDGEKDVLTIRNLPKSLRDQLLSHLGS